MAFYTNRRLLNKLLSPLTTENNPKLLHWHYTEIDDTKNYQIHNQTLFYIFILFSIILLIILVLLYARWYFRFRHVGHYNHSHAPHAPPTRGKGLDELVIKAIPIILHQGSGVGKDDEMECCICLGVFEDGDKVKVLHECMHRFHCECVDRWLIGQGTCPLCRVSVGSSPSLSDVV